jgi:signal transduction histidine kinase
LGWLDTRRIPILLAAATLLPIAALCWLGVRTLAQDRELERQRHRDRLEVVAGRIALEIERNLQAIDARLVQGRGIRLLPTGLESDHERMLYQPVEPPLVPPASPELLEAARHEFQRADLVAAAAAYQRLARSPASGSRGAALVGLGRVLRRQGRREDALRTYDELGRLGPELVAGQPAALVAHQGRARTLEEAGDSDRLEREVAALARALYAGEWSIGRATFELYRDFIRQWGGPAPDADRVRRTNAAIELWAAWRRNELADRGRRFVGNEADPVLAIWVSTGSGPVAELLTGRQFDECCRAIGRQHQASVALIHADGRPIFGARAENDVTLSPGDTRLPFIIAVSSTTARGADNASRRRAVVAGLVLALALMVAASFGLHRITRRELLLARQQADFVAAVSHEFRTPLTSMRHLTDLLAAGSITSEDRKAHYYSLLAHETERLHRMVESLLSFGRMDAGAHCWRLERVDVRSALASIVEEFRRDAPGRPIHLELDDGVPAIEADREALSRAVWNLMENAAKYSPADTGIRVFARRAGHSVVIGVQDSGMGIPTREQQRIFQKFVRGDEARRAGIRGVGIGLALVSRIAEAHGGSVRVESEAGRGSTFTLVIPCHGC